MEELAGANPHDGARLAIAHLKLADSNDLQRALRSAAEISAHTLKVARVGIWLFDRELDALVAFQLYDMRTGFEEGPLTLPLGGWPAYRAAITSRRVLAVDDARTAPETFELDASYLEPRGIASMLDAPVFAEGDVWGILCHEHVGEVRSWQPTEIAFAISVADMLSTLLEQARRIFLADELRSRDAEIARTKANDALVQLAGSVAHDFNTVLQTILLLTESAAEETTLASATSHVQAVVDECKRGSRMARRLLESVRRTAVPPARLDLSRVLQDMERGISALVSPRSTATVSTAAEAWVIGELVEFEQIVLNLVTNARDASASGGRISVVVEKTHDSVTLEVADGGSGIDPATLPRIFDPFFTTKPRGAGTGVGLATVRALVEARGGAVDVTTKLGQGTTIRVRWPAASAD